MAERRWHKWDGFSSPFSYSFTEDGYPGDIDENESIVYALRIFFWSMKAAVQQSDSAQYSIYMMPLYAYDVVLQHARVGEAETMLPQPGRHFRPLAAGGVKIEETIIKTNALFVVSSSYNVSRKPIILLLLLA